MSLKDIPKEELQSMGYDEIAYLVLEQNGKKMKSLGLDENSVMDHITDFFELLSINKKFVLLDNGYWDLAVNHVQNIIVEDDEDEAGAEELEEDDSDITEDTNEEDEDIFYDNDLDNDDEEEDDLKDLVILDEEEEIYYLLLNKLYKL